MSQPIKYGKIGFRLGDVRSLGRFTLETKPVTLSYKLSYVFRFQLSKQMVRGGKVIRADVFGYAFVNPIKGIINEICYKDGKYPQPQDIKDATLRECTRLVEANAFEDKPSLIGLEQTIETPSLIPVDKVQKDVLKWITQNLVVTKTYIQSSSIKGFSRPSTRGADLGLREAKFTFNKKDFVDFSFLGCFAVPTFHLAYQHPNSTQTFNREVLGYSGEIAKNEIKCSKTKMLGKQCENFPDYVCSVCGNLCCSEHQNQCEKCGNSVCKECVVSKGLISKHYYCPKCAS